MEEELKEQIHAAIMKSTVVIVPVVVVVTNCVIRKE